MLVIFLDVDGVIDSSRRKNRIDSSKLANLISAVQQTQSKVVISSHWRLVQPLHSQLRATLRYCGIPVIGSTTVRPPSRLERPIEIIEWIEAFNRSADGLKRPRVTNFVAIDDRDLLAEQGGSQLMGHFVRTDAKVGLTAGDVEHVVKILSDPPAILPGEFDGAKHSEEFQSLTPAEFGEVRLSLDHGSDPRSYTCTLAFKDSWNGTKVGCGDGTGPRPAPWLVLDTDPSGKKCKGSTSSAERYVQMGWLGRMLFATDSSAAKRQDKSVHVRTPDAEAAETNEDIHNLLPADQSWLNKKAIVGATIGSGAFGVVYLGHLRDGGERAAVAIKRAPGTSRPYPPALWPLCTSLPCCTSTLLFSSLAALLQYPNAFVPSDLQRGPRYGVRRTC